MFTSTSTRTWSYFLYMAHLHVDKNTGNVIFGERKDFDRKAGPKGCWFDPTV